MIEVAARQVIALVGIVACSILFVVVVGGFILLVTSGYGNNRKKH